MKTHFAVKEFREDIEEKNYQDAAKRYYNWAYMFQKEFNEILDEMNHKNEVINELQNLQGYGDYVDQI
jgi:CRISPR/Cas system CSM-associated protein Csm4 (group 5 of RAMP superfamily)